ncbi:MAG: hypothetical protein ACRDD8_06000 [Bacteroidales bacterium]
MILTIAQRLDLGGIMPKENNFFDYMIKKHIQDIITIKPDELELYQIKTRAEGGLTYSTEAEKQHPFDADFKEEHIKYLFRLYKQICEDEQAMFSDSVFDVLIKIKAEADKLGLE